MHLHDFLSEVHKVVQPRVYMEVGVQHGTSLRRAKDALVAIGIDPNPLIEPEGNQHIYAMTSDDYFDEALNLKEHVKVDFGFIDGLHHFEVALRDFLNMEKLAHSRSVIIFDDVLPRNEAEAAREQCPGDWTGDVWKVTHMLLGNRPDLYIHEVNTYPTGTLMVYGFNRPGKLVTHWDKIAPIYRKIDAIPEATLKRAFAIDPSEALEVLKNFLSETE